MSNNLTSSPSLNSKSSCLKIRPKELVYHPPFMGVITNELKLYNSSDEHTLAFKVKTTAPIRYCVRPNTGIIPPGKSIDVQILLNCTKDSPSISMKTKDKFQILSIIVTDPNIDPKSIWTNSPSNNITKHKLKAVFSLPSNEQSPSSSTITSTTTNTNTNTNTNTTASTANNSGTSDYKSNSTIFSEVNNIKQPQQQEDNSNNNENSNSNNNIDHSATINAPSSTSSTSSSSSLNKKSEVTKRNINNNTPQSDLETEKLRNQLKDLNEKLEKMKKTPTTSNEVAPTKGFSQIQMLIILVIIAVLSFVFGKFVSV